MKTRDRIAIICLLATGGALPLMMTGCAADSSSAVGAEQGLRDGDRGKNVDGAANGAAGRGARGDHDRDMDEAADEAAAAADADAGADEHECRNGRIRGSSRGKHDGGAITNDGGGRDGFRR
jgi:hypothetical protein